MYRIDGVLRTSSVYCVIVHNHIHNTRNARKRRRKHVHDSVSDPKSGDCFYLLTTLRKMMTTLRLLT
jgi:hypothetical protein